MRLGILVASMVVLAGGVASALEEGKSPPAAPVPAARKKGVTQEAKDAFALIDKAVYCPLRDGASDLTGTIVLEGRTKTADETRFVVKARAPEEVKVTSTILTDVKGLRPKDAAEVKQSLVKTERTIMLLLRRFMGMFRPFPGTKHDAATEALPDGGTLLVVTLYEDGKPDEREFLTLDPTGLPLLLETTTPDVEIPPSRAPKAAEGETPADGKGPKPAAKPVVKTFTFAWEKGEKGARLKGYDLRSSESTTTGECSVRWVPHGERFFFARYVMKNGGSIWFREMKVGGKAVDLSPLDKPETPETPK
jgi:hypothetical protein